MGDFNPANYHDDFVSELVGFVASDDFQSLFEQFFLKYAVEFDYGEEQKLRYYEIYQDFHGLFERKLEQFCNAKGVSQVEFLKRCREATVEDDKAKHYMNILLSSVEYETFIKLMHIMRPVAERRLAMEAESKAMTAKYGATNADGKDVATSANMTPNVSAKITSPPASSKETAPPVDDDADVKPSSSIETELADMKVSEPPAEEKGPSEEMVDVGAKSSDAKDVEVEDVAEAKGGSIVEEEDVAKEVDSDSKLGSHVPTPQISQRFSADSKSPRGEETSPRGDKMSK